MPNDQASPLRALATRPWPPPAAAVLTVPVLGQDVAVLVTATPLVDADGQPAYGIHDYDNRRIVLSTRTPRGLLFNVLAHELWHCHRCEFPSPLSDEADCNLFALAAEAVVRLVAETGGVDALVDRLSAAAGKGVRRG